MDDQAITLGTPDETHDDDLHIYKWHAATGPVARIVVDQVGDRGGQLKGEVSVYWLHDQPVDVRPIAGPSEVNLLTGGGNSGVSSLARESESRVADVDWKGALQHAKVETVHYFRSGTRGTRLGQNPDRKFEPPFLIRPWIASSGSTVMYGRGGLAKSTIALGMAVSVASGLPIFGDTPRETGPVVYFDYEDDEAIHDARMMAICKPLGLDPTQLEIYHVPLTAKVSNAAASMKRRVREYEAVFYVIDSVGMGRGGDAASAEDTIRLFRALRGMGLPVLAIDHISKAVKAQESRLDNADAFGSTYTMNSVRNAWWFAPVVSLDDHVIRVMGTNTKTNHTRQSKNRGINITFASDEDVPKSIDFEVVDEIHETIMDKRVTVKDRMVITLIGNETGLTYDQFVETLDVPRNTIVKTVSLDAKMNEPMFEKVKAHGFKTVRLVKWDTLTHLETEGGPEESASDEE